MACPNINSPEWKALVNKIGVFNAFKEFVKNNEQIPNAIDYPETFKGVNATLKVVGALQQIKRPSYPSNQIQGFYNDLIKLGTPKSQIELLKQHIENKGIKEINTNELAISLLSEMSYTIEINTAKEPTINKNVDYETDGIFDEEGNFQSENTTFSINGYLYEKDKFKHIPFGYGKIKSEDGYIGNNQWETISEREYEEALEKFKNKEGNERPTQHYSNLTVPGGTNYTENEIATPLITPSIKGHAQFSTSNGIGWFRSDDKIEFLDKEDLIRKGIIKQVPCG